MKMRYVRFSVKGKKALHYKHCSHNEHEWSVTVTGAASLNQRQEECLTEGIFLRIHTFQKNILVIWLLMKGACSSGDMLVTVDSSAVNEAINALSAALIKSSSETVPDMSFDIPCGQIWCMYVCMYVCMYIYILHEWMYVWCKYLPPKSFPIWWSLHPPTGRNHTQ